MWIRRNRAKRAFDAGGASAAISEMPSIETMLRDPERWRDRLGGRLTLVNAMSAPVVTDGGTLSCFSAFVIDTGGAAHDLVVSGDAILVANFTKTPRDEREKAEIGP